MDICHGFEGEDGEVRDDGGEAIVLPVLVAVNVKNAFKSLVARSLLVGTVIPFINVISSPRSETFSRRGSSAITATQHKWM